MAALQDVTDEAERKQDFQFTRNVLLTNRTETYTIQSILFLCQQCSQDVIYWH